MRESCFDCTRKHLAQALILMIEAKMGYPLHRYLAIGHMAEAEAEFLAEDEPTANYIRAKRKAYESGQDVDIFELIELVCEIEHKHNNPLIAASEEFIIDTSGDIPGRVV